MTQTLTPQQGLPQYEITDTDKQRQQDIAAAWRAYNGLLPPPLAKMEGQADDNVLSNRMQPIVDRGVDLLFGKELEISVEEGVDQSVQEFLDTTWGKKETRIPLLQRLGMNGAMAGRPFLRILPQPDKTYRLVPIDPATVFVRTAAQDCETVELFCIEYCNDDTVNGAPARVYYREEILRIDPDNDGDNGDPFADTDATWQISHWTRVGEKGQWVSAGSPIIWPYPFPPIHSCQNLPRPNDFWATPDITPDLIGLNNSLNFVQSNINRINKLYGGPILYANGVGESEIDVRPGKIIGLPLPDSKISAVALTSDIANALAFANNLRSDIDELSSVPGVATGRIADMPRGQISGVAIELLFMPLLMKTEKKRCLYGELILDVCRALLTLNNMDPTIEITLNWQGALPEDDLQSVQAAVAKQGLGISNATLQRELGYDPDVEAEQSQAEDQQKMLAYSRGMGMPPSPPAQPAQPFGGSR